MLVSAAQSAGVSASKIGFEVMRRGNVTVSFRGGENGEERRRMVDGFKVGERRGFKGRKKWEEEAEIEVEA